MGSWGDPGSAGGAQCRVGSAEVFTRSRVRWGQGRALPCSQIPLRNRCRGRHRASLRWDRSSPGSWRLRPSGGRACPRSRADSGPGSCGSTAPSTQHLRSEGQAMPFSVGPPEAGARELASSPSFPPKSQSGLGIPEAWPPLKLPRPGGSAEGPAQPGSQPPAGKPGARVGEEGQRSRSEIAREGGLRARVSPWPPLPRRGGLPEAEGWGEGQGWPGKPEAARELG